MRAFVISESDTDLSLHVGERKLGSDEVTVAIEWSGINFKDAMVAQAGSRVRRVAELVGGVDAAGVVTESHVAHFSPGDRVVVHGGDIGVGRDGGFAEYVVAPARYVSLLPNTLSTRDAMAIGTAGFTAMASVLALEHHGIADGEVLVTGATGGVGSFAVALLAARSHHPVASTGSPSESEWLLEQGAVRVIGRDEVSDRPGRVLGSELWAGAIDCVGGSTLGEILRCLRYGAAVAASGLVGSPDLMTTVYPFITRSVALLGIDSPEASIGTRTEVWAALGAVRHQLNIDSLVYETIGLDEIPNALDIVRNGKTRGRYLVAPTPGR
jgi:putative YhdH/YhfP family quinone oxidoreductase